LKKVFVICQLNDLKTKESVLNRCQIVGFRGKGPDEREVFFKNNLDCYPPERFRMDYDKKSGEFIIAMKVYPGDVVALGDEDGVAIKEVVG